MANRRHFLKTVVSATALVKPISLSARDLSFASILQESFPNESHLIKNLDQLSLIHPKFYGKLTRITIENEQRVVKKFCINDAQYRNDEQLLLYVKRLYASEKHAYSMLQKIASRYIPGNIEFFDKDLTIRMDYQGLSLSTHLDRDKNFLGEIDFEHQLREMFNEYKSLGFFKQILGLKHICLNRTDKRIYAVGFRSVRSRNDQSLVVEALRLQRALGWIDPNLHQKISDIYSDFDNHKIKDLLGRLQNISSHEIKLFANQLPAYRSHIQEVDLIKKFIRMA